MCSCDQGWFEVAVGESTCKPCNAKCLACSGNEAKCTKCAGGITRNHTTNYCLCSEGYVEVGKVEC